MEINEVLSFKDLTKLLNISNNKLTRLTKEGLPYISLGGNRKIFLRDAVLNWLENKQK